MNGLILETSTEKGCLILTQNGIPIAEQTLPDGPRLSKVLASEVQYLITKHSFRPEFIAVGTGPGSYTGIRVGAALASALGFGWGIPVLGFCSLQAFIPKNKDSFAVLIDARIGGLYVLTHDSQVPSLLSLDEAQKKLQNIPILASPHPQTIQKRIALENSWIETSPNTEALSIFTYNLFLSGENPPLSLSYLSPS